LLSTTTPVERRGQGHRYSIGREKNKLINVAPSCAGGTTGHGRTMSHGVRNADQQAAFTERRVPPNDAITPIRSKRQRAMTQHYAELLCCQFT